MGVVLVPAEPVVPGPGVEDPKMGDPEPEELLPVPGVLLNPEADPSPPLELAIPPPKMLDFA